MLARLTDDAFSENQQQTGFSIVGGGDQASVHAFASLRLVPYMLQTNLLPAPDELVDSSPKLRFEYRMS